MMTTRNSTTFTTAFLGILWTVDLARAAMPEEYRKLWHDPEVAARIQEDTEQYRKADAVIEVVDAQGAPVRGAKVEVEQQTHEFLFGCNLFVLGQLDTPELNQKYEQAFARLFNFATLPFYWGDLEPEQGNPRFAEGADYIWRRPPPDVLLRWCRDRGITPKGHALLYAKNKFMPAWTIRDNPEAFMRQARKHVAELAARYRDEIRVWDVINEEIPRVANPDQWHAVPKDYAIQCFEHAGRLFPESVVLLINDGTTQTHVTIDKCEANVRQLLDRGGRVDGIGIQFHSGRNSHPPKQLIEVYDRLGKLGLPLYITEITIPGTEDDGPALQGEVVENLYRLWFSTAKMAGVTWWNLGDGTAYGEENKSLGGLLDEQMNPKPAFEALDKLIHREWKTRTDGETGVDGRFAFRGFKGRYQGIVRSGGKEQEFSIEVSDRQDDVNPQQLTFQIDNR